jgi:hypothetical protein
MRSGRVIMNGRTYNGNFVAPETAARIHNQYHNKPFPMDPHYLKCNDNFSVRDDFVKLVSFYAGEPRFVIFANGEKQYHADEPINVRWEFD